MLKNNFHKEIEDTLKNLEIEIKKDLLNDDTNSAIDKIDNSLRIVTGLKLNTISVLSFESLKNMIEDENEHNGYKYLALGVYLALYFNILKKQGKEEYAIDNGLKSIHSLYIAYTIDDELDKEILKNLKDTFLSLSAYNLELSSDKEIFYLYEISQMYDKAEDTLFYILRKTDNNSTELINGMKFYNRLKLLDEDTLKEGNLPINEVTDGIEEIEKRLCN
ncbi:DUF6483 family protein [Clostridium sp. BJN0001]|uniref:DUF6483 family protein n=1 Tax=Clostridium sp. BJN0001 TaxID=2930219 RepID=UPI001FD36D6D|nr:DUF6483 family protein [Clostridium sp. BJN0001]